MTFIIDRNIAYHLLVVMMMVFFSQSRGVSQDLLSIEDWNLISTNDNLQVYTRNSEFSSVKDLRITLTMRGSVIDVMEVLDDVERYGDWVYKCEHPERITTLSNWEFYYYVQTDMPFPASDRDLIIHSYHQIDPATGIYRAHSLAAPAYLPEREGLVRIHNFESFWTVTPTGQGRVSIDYRVRTDPGGNIPAWIVNLGISVGPVRTMEQFTSLVQEHSTRIANREDE